MSRPTGKQLAFANWLEGLTDQGDRGTLAALRRGLMLEEEHLFELFGHIPPQLLAGLRPREERVFLMVSALYAYHPKSFSENELAVRRRNLGESLRLLAMTKVQQNAGVSEDEDLIPESLKRRVNALLGAPSVDLFGHLRQVISLLKSEEIPVDWALLLRDLQWWDSPDRHVQWQWSRSFYVGHESEHQSESEGEEVEDVH